MDLLEKVRNLLGCEYISDMRSERFLKTAKRIVSTIDLTLYSAKELADMTEYLYDKQIYDKSKNEIITYLKNAV